MYRASFEEQDGDSPDRRKTNPSGNTQLATEMPGDAPEPPRETLFRMAEGYRNTAALYVVAKLGVADFLADGPAGCDELARKVGAHPRSLFRVMRALAAKGLFTQDSSDRFGLTQIGRLLMSDVPDSMRYVVIAFGEEHYRAAGHLIHTVKTGETAFDHLYGKGHFEWLAENEEAGRTFHKFMIQSLARSGNPLESYDFDGRELIVDVGGGQGALLAHILRSNPRLRGILFDLPQGVEGASSYLEVNGVLDRCQVVSGSFFDSVPPGGDVYLLSRILHDWPDEKAGMILANCREAIRDDGVLVVRDTVIPEGDAPSVGKQLDLTMMTLLGGMERTRKEWSRLLGSSGFELKKVVKTGQPFDIIEGSPVG